MPYNASNRRDHTHEGVNDILILNVLDDNSWDTSIILSIKSLSIIPYTMKWPSPSHLTWISFLRVCQP